MKTHANKTQNTQWVLVANGGRAQLFESEDLLETLTPIEAHTHPESRLPASELVAGDRGATRAFAGGSHSRYERHSDPHQTTVDAFARELAEVLNVGRVAHRFEQLVLVAPPAFLGALRSHLDVDTSRLVLTSIAHDWTDVPQHELPARVRGGLPEVEPGND